MGIHTSLLNLSRDASTTKIVPDFDLFQSLVDKICHDIATPITALINCQALIKIGISKDNAKGAGTSQALDLAEASLQKLLDALNFSNILFGTDKGIEIFTPGTSQELAGVLSRRFASQKISVRIQPLNALLHLAGARRLAPILLVCFEDLIKAKSSVELGSERDDQIIIKIYSSDSQKLVTRAKDLQSGNYCGYQEDPTLSYAQSLLHFFGCSLDYGLSEQEHFWMEVKFRADVEPDSLPA